MFASQMSKAATYVRCAVIAAPISGQIGDPKSEQGQSRDRDKRALTIRCIVVPAEPFTPPSAKFGRPGALDSSVDCVGLLWGKMGRQCRKTPLSARSSPNYVQPPDNSPRGLLRALPEGSIADRGATCNRTMSNLL